MDLREAMAGDQMPYGNPGTGPPQGQLSDDDLQKASDEQFPAMIQQRFDNLLRVLDNRTLAPELQSQMIEDLVQKLSSRRKITQQKGRQAMQQALQPGQQPAPAPAAPAGTPGTPGMAQGMAQGMAGQPPR
jgi:hypothetical protein